jgi:lipopolysaccharide export system protein LptC
VNTWITALVLVSLSALSFWVWRELEDEAAPLAAARVHEPDYYIENMVRRAMGEAGELRNILRADLVLHYPDDDSTELARPRMEIYNGGSEPWRVIAERGWVSSGSEVVLLHGQVEIWRVDQSGAREFEVFTSELRVLPKEQYAETDDPATIKNSTTTTTTIGMRANFSHDRLELLQRVRSRHEVKPRS